VKEAVSYGVFFALVAGVLVDFNQYVLYPIPALVAVMWFVGGLIEFTVYALVARPFFASEMGPAARSERAL
jgi:hypothetical protein